jgi:hypothetical protein
MPLALSLISPFLSQVVMAQLVFKVRPALPVVMALVDTLVLTVHPDPKARMARQGTLA